MRLSRVLMCMLVLVPCAFMATAVQASDGHSWPIPGDATLDCKVDSQDVNSVTALQGKDPSAGNNWQADLNEDGVIDSADLDIVNANLGRVCQATVQPGFPTFCAEETQCSIDQTACPATPTECFSGDTICPVTDTECPENDTSCPSIATFCPLWTASPCPSLTECPTIATECPKTETSCPPIYTTCIGPDTVCPRPTVCAIDVTTCPKQTICPTNDTTCPVNRTTCPVVYTMCNGDVTLCSTDAAKEPIHRSQLLQTLPCAARTPP